MAAAPTFQVIYQEGSDKLDLTVTLSADGVDKRPLSIPTGTVDQEVSLEFTLASLKGYWISSTKAITIKTNSTSSPGDTVPVVANEPLFWNNKMGNSKHFTVDVTKLFISNASGATAAIDIRVAKDATPP